MTLANSGLTDYSFKINETSVRTEVGLDVIACLD